jgi:tetratricopeptide (TPR) repeat protein
MIAGAAVTVARLAEPDRPLARAESDSAGHFTLELPAADPSDALVIKASMPSGIEGYEFPRMVAASEEAPLLLILRKPGENYEDPSLDMLDAWLLDRLKYSCGPKAKRDCALVARNALVKFRKRKMPAISRAAEALNLLRQKDTPQLRLVAAVALMRLGAWQTAETVLTGFEDDRFKLEQSVLASVRLNFLKSPQVAATLLARTLPGDTADTVDPLVYLELGRAAILEEDWPTALQRLDPALQNKRLEPYGRYLRARALFALGDIEAAAEEARMLTRRVRKRRLPVNARAFVEDLLGRLDEESIQSIQSVMKQPVPELQKAVPSLAKLDTTPPLEGPDLPLILKKTGEGIEKFFREFSSTSSLEVLRQSVLDKKGKSHAVRRAEMYYVFQQKSLKGKPMVEEIRGRSDGQPDTIGGLEQGFMASTGFASSLIVFHPISQPSVDYRYLGRQEWAGRPVYVVGFAQRPGEAAPMGVFRSTARQSSARVYVQGVAWISGDQFQIVRLRTDLLEPIPDAGLNRQTSEIDYRPYQFLINGRSYLLPSRVTVSIDWFKRRLRNEHIFSRFWLFNVEADSGDERRLPRTSKPGPPTAAVR